MDPTARGIAAGALAHDLPRLFRGRPHTIIAHGDSITAGSSAEVTPGVWQYGNTGWPEQAMYQAGGRVRVQRNAGVPGNTTAQMLARFQTDVLAYSPAIVTIQGGTNDVTAGAANSVFTTLFNNLEQMVVMALKAGVLPVIVCPPPKNSANLEMKLIQPLYYRLAQHYRLPLIDLFRILANANSLGLYTAGVTLDNVHPNAYGCSLIAPIAASVLQNLTPCGAYLAACSETALNNMPNLLRNGNFAAVTTPPNPDTWTVNSANATVTDVAPTQPYTGNTFNYQKTGGTGVFALSGGTPNAGYSAGDVLIYSGHLNVSGLTSSSATGFQVSLTFAGPGFVHKPINNYVGNGDYIFETEVTVPAGTTSMTPAVFVQDVGTYQVNNLTLINKTAYDAIWKPGQQGLGDW